MNIMGLHGGVTVGQHDAGAALISKGKLVCFVEEERLTRVKTSTGILPVKSLQACLDQGNLKIKDIDLIVIPGETYKDIKDRTQNWIRHHFGFSPRIKTINHQLAHLASSFYQSDFDNAMCLSYDFYGDGISGALGVASKDKGVKILKKLSTSSSLGLFYATMTSFLGFKPGEDEYKVMGLASYGNPTYDLSFFCRKTLTGNYVNFDYFRSNKASTQLEPYYNEKLVAKLGKPRLLNGKIDQRIKNLAASTQKTLEECAISNIEHLYKLTNNNNLCLAGGVALNCTANGKIIQIPYLDKFFVQPSSSDRGLALGCAYQGAFINKQPIPKIHTTYFGPKYAKTKILNDIKISGVKYKKINQPEKLAAKLISDGKIIGWYQGRSEFGPRALGNRSILADPTHPKMKSLINKKVKFREEFRPFAPAVTEDGYKKYFDMEKPSPFMTVAYKVKSKWRSTLKAITHVNNTARVQTVNKKQNLRFYNLLRELGKINKHPVVLNTSFNIRGQPIVETPLEAISTFAGSGIDKLIIENYLLEK